MFSREEAKQLRSEFWTAFGLVMKPHYSQWKPKISWVNYKIGISGLYIRLIADTDLVGFAIDLQQKDEGIRSLFYEQFEEYKTILEAEIGEELTWSPTEMDELGIEKSRIYCYREGLSLFRKEDWPDMFQDLKKWVLGWDSFWANCNDPFIELAR